MSIRRPWHLERSICEGWTTQDYPFDREEFLGSRWQSFLFLDKRLDEMWNFRCQIFPQWELNIFDIKISFIVDLNHSWESWEYPFCKWIQHCDCSENYWIWWWLKKRLESFNSKKIMKWSFICLLWMLGEQWWKNSLFKWMIQPKNL